MCVCVCVCMLQAQKQKILQWQKSITSLFLRVSLSCYKWLTEQLACHGWQISHTVAWTHSSASWHRSLRSIFMSLSGVGSAAKREDPLGRDGCNESFQRPGTVWQDLWIPQAPYDLRLFVTQTLLCVLLGCNWNKLNIMLNLISHEMNSWQNVFTVAMTHIIKMLSYSCLYNWPPMAARCWVNFSLQLN